MYKNLKNTFEKKWSTLFENRFTVCSFLRNWNNQNCDNLSGTSIEWLRR